MFRVIRNFRVSVHFQSVHFDSSIRNYGGIITIYQRFYSVQQSNDKLQFLREKYAYLKVCKLIESKSNEVTSLQLTRILEATVNHKSEKYFISRVLEPWWRLFRSKVNNFRGPQIVFVLYNLEKVNKLLHVKGDLLECLSWSSVEKLAYLALRDINSSNFTPQHLSMLLRTLLSFANAHNLQLSRDFVTTLSNALTSILFNQTNAEKEILEITRLLLPAVRLGLPPPPNESLAKVKCFFEDFLDRKTDVMLKDEFEGLCTIGGAFLTWNFDPGSEFWRKYFEHFAKNYDTFQTKERFSLTTLKTFVLIGLTFCPNEFQNIDHFWKIRLLNNVAVFRLGEIDEILNLCVKQYKNDVDEIEKVISQEVFEKLLRRTNNFLLETVGGKTFLKHANEKPSETTKIREIKIDKTTYEELCRQISLFTDSAAGSIPTKLLLKMLLAVAEFNDAKNFVGNHLVNWWMLIEQRLDNLIHYAIPSHLLLPLVAINESTNGVALKKLEAYNSEAIRELVSRSLTSIAEDRFVLENFESTLQAVEKLYSKRKKIIPQLIVDDLWTGFETIFRPDFFERNLCGKQEFYPNVGNILYLISKMVKKKPQDFRIKLIIDCCARNFGWNETRSTSIVDHLYDSSFALDTLLLWNVNADKYFPSFWRLYFKEIVTNFSQLNQTSDEITKTLKFYLLRNILFVVLMFDKEDEFDSIKNFWQREIGTILNDFTTYEINTIFTLSKRFDKFNRLEKIVSTDVFEAFRRKVPYSFNTSTFI